MQRSAAQLASGSPPVLQPNPTTETPNCSADFSEVVCNQVPSQPFSRRFSAKLVQGVPLCTVCQGVFPYHLFQGICLPTFCQGVPLPTFFKVFHLFQGFFHHFFQSASLSTLSKVSCACPIRFSIITDLPLTMFDSGCKPGNSVSHRFLLKGHKLCRVGTSQKLHSAEGPCSS